MKSHLPALREDLERERYLRLMPGYVQRLVTRAAPLLGLGIDGDVASGFRLHGEAPSGDGRNRP